MIILKKENKTKKFGVWAELILRRFGLNTKTNLTVAAPRGNYSTTTFNRGGIL
ncbi:MAG: hypothetical protein JNK33_04960 [Candidatus Doudnabacteria bacterium]|nr:hypothetical protein [Candidatus Doudnabacteria bacterium]